MIVNCKFLGNYAADDGAALSTNYGANPTLVNCTFAGNVADGNLDYQGGGAVSNWESDPVFINCTFCQNTSADNGGGMCNSQNSNPIVTNCIFCGNADDAEGTLESAQIYDDETSTTTVCHSCIQGLDTYAGCGNVDCDPQFVRDPHPGPDGEWGTEDDDYGDLHLSAGSCCIEAGDTTVVLTLGVFGDLDGYARVVDDPLTPDTGVPAGLLNDVVDMGAYEYKYRIPGDINGDGCVDQSDLGILLANWGMGCCF
jgi:hypothetical protein